MWSRILGLFKNGILDNYKGVGPKQVVMLYAIGD